MMLTGIKTLTNKPFRKFTNQYILTDTKLDINFI